jgi:hypothetical protein
VGEGGTGVGVVVGNGTTAGVGVGAKTGTSPGLIVGGSGDGESVPGDGEKMGRGIPETK